MNNVSDQNGLSSYLTTQNVATVLAIGASIAVFAYRYLVEYCKKDQTIARASDGGSSVSPVVGNGNGLKDREVSESAKNKDLGKEKEKVEESVDQLNQVEAEVLEQQKQIEEEKAEANKAARMQLLKIQSNLHTEIVNLGNYDYRTKCELEQRLSDFEQKYLTWDCSPVEKLRQYSQAQIIKEQECIKREKAKKAEKEMQAFDALCEEQNKLVQMINQLKEREQYQEADKVGQKLVELGAIVSNSSFSYRQKLKKAKKLEEINNAKAKAAEEERKNLEYERRNAAQLQQFREEEAREALRSLSGTFDGTGRYVPTVTHLNSDKF